MAHALRLPRVEQLSSEPQLASLAVLETAANVAILALAAEHPELGGDDDIQRDDDDELRAALDLVELARAIGITIMRYRRALAERQRSEQQLLPF
jgi:hypothetical protein